MRKKELERQLRILHRAREDHSFRVLEAESKLDRLDRLYCQLYDEVYAPEEEKYPVLVLEFSDGSTKEIHDITTAMKDVRMSGMVEIKSKGQQPQFVNMSNVLRYWREDRTRQVF